MSGLQLMPFHPYNHYNDKITSPIFLNLKNICLLFSILKILTNSQLLLERIIVAVVFFFNFMLNCINRHVFLFYIPDIVSPQLWHHIPASHISHSGGPSSPNISIPPLPSPCPQPSSSIDTAPTQSITQICIYCVVTKDDTVGHTECHWEIFLYILVNFHLLRHLQPW